MIRYVTRKSITCFVVFAITALSSIGIFKVIQRTTSHTCVYLVPAAPVQPPANVDPAPVAQREEPQQLVDIFGEEDLSYNGYELRRLTEKVSDEMVRDLEISYAALMKDNRRLLKFDGVYFSEGNSTWLGLFDLFGNGSQQFIISQTVPRGGRHWVVSVSPTVRVLFDSFDYGVGRAEFYVIDIDKDGVYEIVLPVTAFYEMQDKMYIGEIPLPEIIFKYDAKAGKYLPANHRFLDYALHGIQEDIAKLPPKDDLNYLSRRLDILLRYVYARKANFGWSFFEREYQRPDKAEIKARIRSVLKRAPLQQRELPSRDRSRDLRRPRYQR